MEVSVEEWSLQDPNFRDFSVSVDSPPNRKQTRGSQVRRGIRKERQIGNESKARGLCIGFSIQEITV